MASFILPFITSFLILDIGFVWLLLLKENNIYVKYCTKPFTFSIISLVLYIMAFYSQSQMEAHFLKCLFYISTIWLMYYNFDFITKFTKIKIRIKYFNIILLSLSILDTILILTNIPYKWLFTTETLLLKQSSGLFIVYWGLTNTHFFQIHFLISSIPTTLSICLLVIKIYRVPSAYRRNYLYFLFLQILIIVITIISYSLRLPVDISVFLYAFLINSLFLNASTVTPRRIIKRSLQLTNDSSHIGICCFNTMRELTYSNEAFKKLFNVTKKNEKFISEQYLNIIISKNDISTEPIFSTRELFIQNEKEHIYSVIYQVLFDGSIKIGYMLRFNDITEKIERYEAERIKASHDALTGLYNRERFFIKADEKLNEAPGAKWLMLCINIKDFKMINQIRGEEIGDEVLLTASDLLQKYAHKDTLYARISDDKFAILMKQADFDEDNFRNGVNMLSCITNINNFKLQVNIGIYRTNFAMENALLMYDKAHLALEYQTDSYLFMFAEYDDSIMSNLIKERNIISDFDYALSTNQFEMYLQPQITKNEKLVGAEALARWIQPGSQPILPEFFIPTLEKSGLIYKLDKFIWEKAAQKLNEWAEKGYDDYYISVNVSAKDFYYMDIYKVFTRLERKYGFDPSKLKIEITETVLMENLSNTLSLLEKLKNHGFVIEIDDFGTKYSSLNMLKDVPADVIKIDMNLVKSTDEYNKAKVILNKIIEMAKILNMQVVIEGVETNEQRNFIKTTDCDLIQGFYYSKPLATKDFENKYLLRK